MRHAQKPSETVNIQGILKLILPHGNFLIEPSATTGRNELLPVTQAGHLHKQDHPLPESDSGWLPGSVQSVR